jgi:hypothetical protein
LEVSVHRLLTATLITGMAVVSAGAQRAASSGHAGSFSAPHGFSAPHVSGGFSAGSHFSPAPVMNQHSFSTPPQYRWSMPARSTGNPSSYMPNGSRYSPDKHSGRPPYYSGYHYRQPYVPYFYANATYLVPGLLNSYWDSPGDTYSGDQAASTVQGPAENSGDYEPEAPPYETQQAQDIPPPPPGPIEPMPQAAVTLVFKDGHSQQIHNYAMTKTTLYILDDAASGRRPEVSLDQIDVSATERTNRQAGIDFSIPATVD